MNEENTAPNIIMSRSVFDSNYAILMLFRCIRRNRAEQFQRGEIFFGSPQQWINIEKQGNKGQGDLLEGVFLSAQSDDNSTFIQDLKADPSIEHFVHNGFLFFRRTAVLNLRSLCMYGLRDNCFQKEIDLDGRAHLRTRISKNYFSSFTTFMTRDECEKAPLPDQSVVVFINNPHEFFNRVQAFLFSLGVKEPEIIISPVEYINRYVPMVAAVPSPSELLLKDTSFAEQSEVRIIINSNSPKYLEYMRDHNNTLTIGSIEDITEIYDYYYDDMAIERYGNKGMLFSLSKSKHLQIQEMGFFELEDLLFNILNGTVELLNLPEECDTWDKKLMFLSDLFFSKFNVMLHVDENKNVFMHNMSQELLKQSAERNKSYSIQSDFREEIEQCIKNGRLEVALERCIEAYNDNLLTGEAHYYAGIVYSKQGNDLKAIEAFQVSFANDYKRIESLDGIASTYFKRGNYTEAIEAYNAIQDEKGYDGRIWCNIGICHIHMQQYSSAIEFFDKAIATNSTDAFPFYNKGVAQYMLKQFKQAKINMEKAIELEPENAVYKREYRKCFP